MLVKLGVVSGNLIDFFIYLFLVDSAADGDTAVSDR